MAKIPFYLVTGFLGSGKTTLLKRYLEKCSETRKVAIIQNEFAEVNIDSQELKRTGKSFEILEMNNGSVFCVCLLGDFVHSLNEFILKHRPDILILEASGLSDPVSISQVLAAPALKNLIWLAHTYTVVDALNFQKTLQRVGRNLHQIRTADTIVLNKTDLVDDTTEIELRIKTINPFAKILKASYCDIDLSNEIKFRPPIQPGFNTENEPAGRPDIDSVVIKTTKNISSINLQTFLQKWSPQTYRMKGFVKLSTGAVTLQTTFDRVEVFEMPQYKDPTQLVILGPQLDSKLMQKEFEDLCTLS